MTYLESYRALDSVDAIKAKAIADTTDGFAPIASITISYLRVQCSEAIDAVIHGRRKERASDEDGSNTMQYVYSLQHGTVL